METSAAALPFRADTVALHFLPSHGVGGNFNIFFACFRALFVPTGIGNATPFRMVPRFLRTLGEREAARNTDVIDLQEVYP